MRTDFFPFSKITFYPDKGYALYGMERGEQENLRNLKENKILKTANFRKAYFYLKKNGWKSVYYAAWERIMSERASSYGYRQPPKDVLEKQKEAGSRYSYRFSILVPAYETKEAYLREMIESVLGQSYGCLELVIADASRSKQVEEVVRTYTDDRIRYFSLAENNGISENTNRALEAAQGDYIGLLDHDDVLTPDALYEMAEAINKREKNGNTVWLLYSDEDKCNGEMTEFYEPHFKPDLNMDLLLSNNYICHFMVMKRELMQELAFRQEYDGAQDYDIVLRAAGKLLYGEDGGVQPMQEADGTVLVEHAGEEPAERCIGYAGAKSTEMHMESAGERGHKPYIVGRKAVVHIPKVLYHWRCHSSSTAENPESKRYAYEAGKRAVEDFLKKRGWEGEVSHTRHLGFYRIDYDKGIFSQREDVGVIAGRLLNRRGRICGGAYDKKGKGIYTGLHKNFSGYMHRAILQQEVYAADLRRMCVRKELWQAFEEVFGVPYHENREGWFEWAETFGILCDRKRKSGIFGKAAKGQRTKRKRMETLSQERIAQCLEFGRRVRKMGYRIVWMPEENLDRRRR